MLPKVCQSPLAPVMLPAGACGVPPSAMATGRPGNIQPDATVASPGSVAPKAWTAPALSSASPACDPENNAASTREAPAESETEPTTRPSPAAGDGATATAPAASTATMLPSPEPSIRTGALIANRGPAIPELLQVVPSASSRSAPWLRPAVGWSADCVNHCRNPADPAATSIAMPLTPDRPSLPDQCRLGAVEAPGSTRSAEVGGSTSYRYR